MSSPETHQRCTPTGAPGEVLVVDDESHVRTTLGDYLATDGFTVRFAADGRAAIDMMTEHLPNLVILDLMLPHVDGLGVLNWIRSRPVHVPVIIVSARGSEPERVLGFDLGADDYVPKPASPREILFRVRAVLRRPSTETEAVIHCGGLKIDREARTVTRNGDALVLRPREFDLLAFFATNPQTAFSRAELLKRVWGSSPEWQDPGTITVHVRRLRSLIEPDPGSPRHLVTVFGIGYRFDP